MMSEAPDRGVVSETKVRFATPEITLTSQGDRRHLPPITHGSSRPTTPARWRLTPPTLPRRWIASQPVSSERSRAVKLALDEDRAGPVGERTGRRQRREKNWPWLMATTGSRSGSMPKYLLEIASQVDRENAVFLFSSPGEPTLMREAQRHDGDLCRDADAGVSGGGPAPSRGRVRHDPACRHLDPQPFPQPPPRAAGSGWAARGALRAQWRGQEPT